MVGDLIEGLAAEKLMRGNDEMDVGGGWLVRLQGWPVKKSAARAWWEKAQKQGEEAYLVERVLPSAAKGDEQAAVNAHLLRVIAAKFPKSIPVVYKTVLEKYPNLDSTPLAAALTRCSLPVKDKLDFLLTAAKHEKYAHLLPAFRAIRELDQKRFAALLLATIEGFKVGTLETYWTCPGAHLAALAVESDEPRVWPTLRHNLRAERLSLTEYAPGFGERVGQGYGERLTRHLVACGPQRPFDVAHRGGVTGGSGGAVAAMCVGNSLQRRHV